MISPAHRRRRSLRFRIVAVAVVVVALLLGLAGLTVVLYVDSTLRSQVDEGLAADADFIARALPAVANLPPESGHPVLLVQVFSTSSGRMVGASESAANLDPLVPTEVLGSTDDPTYLTIPAADAGGTGDLRVYTVPIGETGRLQLAVARPIGEIEEGVAALIRFVALTVPLLATILAVVIWMVVDRALRPVIDMRQTVGSIGPGELGRRVPLSGAGDEIDDLACTVNDMLARLDAAATRQREFVADASHELRSPLAGMRVLLETEGDDPLEVRATRAQALEEFTRLQHLIDDLLALARSDEGAPQPDPVAVDLDESVLRHAAHLRRSAQADVDISQVSGARVMGRPGDLDRMVANLVANAARHARSTVTLSLQSDDAVAELVVADDGPGIAPADRERVFERFTRLDDDRSRVRGGAGLGLAIVADIVAAHGGDVRIVDGPTPGACVVVRLPLEDHHGLASGTAPANGEAAGRRAASTRGNAGTVSAASVDVG
ncbi:MAG: HAMP domain-containing histidine kinase [Acidimicrobiia bacterium]|nr:HAMP domain-containing histidine kinase [Acidimicrobiia bacterium]